MDPRTHRAAFLAPSLYLSLVPPEAAALFERGKKKPSPSIPPPLRQSNLGRPRTVASAAASTAGITPAAAAANARLDQRPSATVIFAPAIIPRLARSSVLPLGGSSERIQATPADGDADHGLLELVLHVRQAPHDVPVQAKPREAAGRDAAGARQEHLGTELDLRLHEARQHALARQLVHERDELLLRDRVVVVRVDEGEDRVDVPRREGEVSHLRGERGSLCVIFIHTPESSTRKARGKQGANKKTKQERIRTSTPVQAGLPSSKRRKQARSECVEEDAKVRRTRQLLLKGKSHCEVKGSLSPRPKDRFPWPVFRRGEPSQRNESAPGAGHE